MTTPRTTTTLVAGSILSAAVAIGVPSVAGAEATTTITRTTPDTAELSEWKGFSLDGKGSDLAVEERAR